MSAPPDQLTWRGKGDGQSGKFDMEALDGGDRLHIVVRGLLEELGWAKEVRLREPHRGLWPTHRPLFCVPCWQLRNAIYKLHSQGNPRTIASGQPGWGARMALGATEMEPLQSISQAQEQWELSINDELQVQTCVCNPPRSGRCARGTLARAACVRRARDGMPFLRLAVNGHQRGRQCLCPRTHNRCTLHMGRRSHVSGTNRSHACTKKRARCPHSSTATRRRFDFSSTRRCACHGAASARFQPWPPRAMCCAGEVHGSI